MMTHGFDKPVSHSTLLFGAAIVTALLVAPAESRSNPSEDRLAARELTTKSRAANADTRWSDCAAAYAQLGEIARGDKRNPYYNAACCASRGDDRDRAFELPQRSIAADYRNLALISEDDDLEALRSDSR